MFPLFNSSTVKSDVPQADVLIDVAFTTTYHITEEYTMALFIGGAVAFGLLLILFIMFLFYKKHKKLYSKLANERMTRIIEKGDDFDETRKSV